MTTSSYSQIRRGPRLLHGLPITPKHLLEQLRGESFCVSFAAPAQLEKAIELQDPEGMLMLDNGAFSHWRAGKGAIDREAFFAWANEAQSQCDVAVAVVPDVIGGAPDGRVANGRALSKIRNDERGAAGAYAQLRSMGAPERRPFESGADYVARALQTFRRIRHPGNHRELYR